MGYASSAGFEVIFTGGKPCKTEKKFNPDADLRSVARRLIRSIVVVTPAGRDVDITLDPSAESKVEQVMLNLLRKLLGGTSASNLTPSTIPPEAHPPATALKYYVYISQTKVDMLFPQIPPEFLKGAEAEVKFTLGVASATLKSRNPEEAKELSARTAVVSSFIRRSDGVGDVSRPGRWIAGSASLQWGVVREYASDIVFFGGKVANKRLALLGSRESLIGECRTAEANHAPYYYTLKFFNQMTEADGTVEDHPPYYSYKSAIDIALEALPRRTTNLEFLAKVLHSESDLLVASPLYVAVLE